MGAKSRKRKNNSSISDLYARAERNLEKGNYRDSVKEARQCYAAQPTDQHRRLLQFAYVARAQELARFGLMSECRAIVDALLQLGVSEPSIEAALPDLYVSLGMLDRLPKAAPSAAEPGAAPGGMSSELLAKIADHAVLRPQNTPPSLPEIRRAAEQVRAALEAVSNNDDAGALELLRDIPRQSPLADWKLFVRGLIAYYANQTQEMAANWNRLDPARRAARIARPLQASAIPVESHESDPRLVVDIETIKRVRSSSPIMHHLRTLDPLFHERNWAELVAKVNRLRPELESRHPQLLHRLLLVIGDRLVHENDWESLESLARRLPGPPLDPRWNRALALCEGDDSDDLERRLRYWRKYLDDLEQIAELTDAERNTTHGLVRLEIANQLATSAHQWRHCTCGRSHDEEANDASERAFVEFEAAIGKLPEYTAAYHSLADAYEDAGQPDQMARTYERLLQNAPNDAEALHAHIVLMLQQGEGIRARDSALQLRRVRPLDKQHARLLGRCHLAAARQYAARNAIEECEREVAAARQLLVAPADSAMVLAHEAALAAKLKHYSRVVQLIDEASNQLGDGAPVWLWYLIELDLSRMPTATAMESWKKALRRKSRGASAALMCRAITFFNQTSDDEQLLNRLTKELVERYLSRCGRVEWQEDDLAEVCRFLFEFDKSELLVKYSKKGRKRFPHNAKFHMWVAQHEFLKGPSRCNRRLARACFQSVISIARDGNNPEVVKMAELAAQQLEMLNLFRSHRHAPSRILDLIRILEVEGELGTSEPQPG